MARLEALVQGLSGGPHEVWVVAPSGNRSGTSHAMSYHRAFDVCKAGERRYAVDAYPADCFAFALSNLFGRDRLPDLVLSGINWGWNVGRDVAYSGTLGVAEEAALYGIDAIALSEADSGRVHERSPSDVFGVELIEQLVYFRRASWRKTLFASINFPDCSAEEVRAVRVSPLGQPEMGLKSMFPVGEPELGLKSMLPVGQSGHSQRYRYASGRYVPPFSGTGSDLGALEGKAVSVTAISLDRTDFACNDDLALVMDRKF